jgi:tetratricopeptide (TPR) repeat protein
MSPEQLRGDRAGASPRSDLYALGATLYELLTLRPAFASTDREELLRRVLQHEPVAPRRVNPSVPRDLETVVQKAMAKEPSARYASAGELAEDLRRFLDDRPILARRPGPIGLAVRWSRRRRAVVVTAAAVLMLALAVSTALLWAAKRRTDAALLLHKQARTQHALAFHYSLATVDQLTRAFGDPVGAPDRARAEEALRVSLSFCDQIARDFSRDESMQEIVAIALRSAGHLRTTRGDPVGRRDYRRAVAVYEALAARHPSRIWLRTRLIETLKEFADLLTAPADAPEAEASLRRALAVADGLVGEKQADPHCFSGDLAPAFNGLAWSLVKQPPARPGDAATAVRLARQATAWDAEQPAYWNTLGAAHYRNGDWAAAAECLERAASHDAGTALDWLLLAAVHQRLGRPAEARVCYHRAARPGRDPNGVDPVDLRAIRGEVERLLGIPPSDTDAHTAR